VDESITFLAFGVKLRPYHCRQNLLC